jgi:hypothetical protein
MRFLHSVRLAVVAFAVLIPAKAWAQQSRSAAPDADPRARIGQDAAKSAALARVPDGSIAAVALKVEHGALVYFCDIAVPGKEGLEEVQVSAVNGEVLSSQHLGPTGGQADQRAQPGHSVARRVGTAEPPR